MKNPIIGALPLANCPIANTVTSIAINSSFDTIVTGSKEGLLIFWQANISENDRNYTGAEKIEICPTSVSISSRFPVNTPILDVSFVSSPFPDSHLSIRENVASLHGDNSICIWSLIDATCTARINSNSKINNLSPLSDRRYLIAFGEGIYILDTWELEIIVSLETKLPLIDVSCISHPSLLNISQFYDKQLICASTKDELVCWDVTNLCLSRQFTQSMLSRSEYSLNKDLLNTTNQVDENNMIEKITVPITFSSFQDGKENFLLGNQICISKNLIFAIEGARITVWIISNDNFDLHPLMDFLNPDISENSEKTGFADASNWQLIQTIDLSCMHNSTNDNNEFEMFKHTYKNGLVALNGQNKIYCYILPDHSNGIDEYPSFQSRVKATYVGKINSELYNKKLIKFVPRGFIGQDKSPRSSRYEGCPLDLLAIYVNCQGIYFCDFLKCTDTDMELLHSMKHIFPDAAEQCNLSATYTIKSSNNIYIICCLSNGNIFCISNKGRFNVYSPSRILNSLASEKKIHTSYRIIHPLPANYSIVEADFEISRPVHYILPLNNQIVLTDGYTICVYKISTHMSPTLLISGWHYHRIERVYPIIVPMGSLVRQSFDHFATIDSSGRIIIWETTTPSSYIAPYGELPHNNHVLERAKFKNIYKIILDELRGLAIVITIKRILIWSLDTHSIISNESRLKYFTLSRMKEHGKLEDSSNITDTFSHLVPQLKKLVYGNDNNHGRIKMAMPQYQNTLYCKELFKDDYFSAGVSNSNIYLMWENNKIVSMPIIITPISGNLAWLFSANTLSVKFLPCNIGRFWTTIHLTLPIKKRYKDSESILEDSHNKLHIYSVRSNYIYNLLNLSHIRYTSHKIYQSKHLNHNLDRIWLLGYYIMIGSLPEQPDELTHLGRKSEFLLRDLITNIDLTSFVHTAAILLGLFFDSRLFVLKLKITIYPPALYIIDRWTFYYIFTQKLSGSLVINSAASMDYLIITEEDVENLGKIQRKEPNTKRTYTGILHVGLNPQFPLSDLASVLFAIFVYQNPIAASQTFLLYNGQDVILDKPNDFSKNLLYTSILHLSYKVFAYNSSFNRVGLTVPPFSGFTKIEHTPLFARLLAYLLPLIPMNTREYSSILCPIMNNVMMSYPHLPIGSKGGVLRLITNAAMYIPDILSNSLHFGQLNSQVVGEIIYYLLKNKLIDRYTLHFYSYYIVASLTCRNNIKNLLYRFPVISIHDEDIAFGFINGKVHYYSIKSGQLLREFYTHSSPIGCIALDSSGEYIAVYQHEQPALHVWKMSSFHFFKNYTVSNHPNKTLELKKLHGNFEFGLDSVKVQFKSKNEWFLHREDGRSYIVRG